MGEGLQRQQIESAGMDPGEAGTVAGLLGQLWTRQVIREPTVVLFRIKTRDPFNKGDQLSSTVSVSDPLHFAKGNVGPAHCVAPPTHRWFIRVRAPAPGLLFFIF